jgi:uncharacterized protein YciI
LPEQLRRQAQKLNYLHPARGSDADGMTFYAVTREAGPAWAVGLGAFGQDGVEAHTSFMSRLADEGLVLFAGPLAGSEQDRLRVLLIAAAPSEDDLRNRLSADPWERSGRICTSGIETWLPLVGADRLATS